jgi:hypothetical protein
VGPELEEPDPKNGDDSALRVLTEMCLVLWLTKEGSALSLRLKRSSLSLEDLAKPIMRKEGKGRR